MAADPSVSLTTMKHLGWFLIEFGDALDLPFVTSALYRAGAWLS